MFNYKLIIRIFGIKIYKNLNDGKLYYERKGKLKRLYL